jgi:hypothetical protein
MSAIKLMDMKKNIVTFIRLLCFVLIVVFYAGCVKDDCKTSFKIFKPVYKTLSAVRSDMQGMAARDMKQTGKLYVYGSFVFISEPGFGIHIIDNSNPSSPVNLSFIPIPGNQDLAVKGDYLYADSYGDLVVFDISNPAKIKVVKFLDYVFPDRSQYYISSAASPINTDSIQIVVDYSVKDTVIDCQSQQLFYPNCPNCFYANASASSQNKAGTSGNGMGGSMARFALVDNYLYTVSSYMLSSFDVTAAANPVLSGSQNMGSWNIETIYPLGNRLFIGSSNGMFVYDLADPANPSKLSSFTHARACDPVVADGNYAYITLRSGTKCSGYSNQLDVLSISDITIPVPLASYPMTNPHGLSKDGKWLFLCDGSEGLKMMDAGNPAKITLFQQFKGMETFDAIAAQNKVIVVATDGVYQFDYSDTSNVHLLSKIPINNQ